MVMQPFAGELLTALQRHHAELVEAAEALGARLSEEGGEEGLPRAALEALMQGLTTLLTAALEGREAAARESLQELVPALLAEGHALEDVVRGSTTFFLLLSTELVRRLPEEFRPEASDWLTTFFGASSARVVQVGLQAEGARKTG